MRTALHSCAQSSLLAALVLLSGCIGPPLLLSPAELPNGVEDSTYSQTLSSDGRSPVWDITGGVLPSGLTLDRRSGAISGTPDAPGAYDFFILATDFGPPGRRGESWYSITVHPKLVLSVSLEAGRIGQAFDQTPTITGGVIPYTVSITGLPAGLDHDPSSGRIFGLPLVDYDARLLEISVTDSGDPQQSVTGQATLVVKPLGVSITTTALPATAVNQVYSVLLEAENGKTPYEWRVDDGVLPDGLRLTRSTGVIAGTVEISAETETFTVAVTDADAPESSDSQQLKLVVNVLIVTESLPNGTAGQAYETAVGAKAGLPPYTWALASGQLPDGLSLDAGSGVISGTLAGGATTSTFTIGVMDSDSPPTVDQQALTIVVAP